MLLFIFTITIFNYFYFIKKIEEQANNTMNNITKEQLENLLKSSMSEVISYLCNELSIEGR